MARSFRESNPRRGAEKVERTNLILGFRLGDSVVIAPEALVLIGKGRAIEVTLTRIDGSYVRLAFTGPIDVRYERIARSKRANAGGQIGDGPEIV